MKFAYTILYVEDVLKTIEFTKKPFNLLRKLLSKTLT